MFAPLGAVKGGIKYIYLGPLADSTWFDAMAERVVAEGVGCGQEFRPLAGARDLQADLRQGVDADRPGRCARHCAGERVGDTRNAA